MVVCLEQADDASMPLPLTVSCFSKIQIGFTFLVPAHLGTPGKRAVKRVCVRVCVCVTRGRVLDCIEADSRWQIKAKVRFAIPLRGSVGAA